MEGEKDREFPIKISGDNRQLQRDLAESKKLAEKSALETGKKMEEIAKKVSSELKKQQDAVTDNLKQQNNERIKSDERVAAGTRSTFKDLAAYAKKTALEIGNDVKEKGLAIIDTIKHPEEVVKKAAEGIKKTVSEAAAVAQDKIVAVGKKFLDGGKWIVEMELHPVGTAKKAGEWVRQQIKNIGKTAEKTAEETEKKSSSTLETIAKDVAVIGKAVEEAGKKSHPVLEKLSKVGAAIGKAAKAAGTAAVEAGADVLNNAVSLDKAMNQYIASTGKGVDETERYQSVLEAIYKDNYGGSFEEIAGAMALVDKQLGDMSDDELRQITESAFALQDVFQYDIANSTEAAKVLMDHFGVSGEEAMGLIAAGAQNGLDASGELLKSISEHSGQFSQIGMDADDMFHIFQQGAETGAFSVEQVGAAVKEMADGVLNGSETTKEGFAAIGLDADEMSEKFAAGGDSAREAFQETMEALANLEDPMEQNAAGISLFGDTWEELGPAAAEALAGIEEGAYNTADAMGSIKEIRFDDLDSMLSEVKRSFEMLVQPVAEQLLPILGNLIEQALPALESTLAPIMELLAQNAADLAPMVEALLPELLDLFNELMPAFQQILEELLPVLLDFLDELIPVFTDIISELLPVLIELFCLLGEPLLNLTETLLPMLVELTKALLPLFELAAALLQPLIESFIWLLDPIMSVINKGIAPLIKIVGDLIKSTLEPLQGVIVVLSGVFSERLGGMLTTAQEIIGNIISIFEGVIDFLTGIFTGDWERAWERVVQIFDGLISGIANIFKIPINWIIDGINGFLNGINSIRVPDWVPEIGGKGFNISLIPRLQTGIDFIPKDFFPAYLDYGERVLTRQENQIYSAVGGLEGLAHLSGYSQAAVAAAGKGDGINYEKLGQVTADAFSRSGVKVVLKDRELGRVVRKEEGR